MKRDLDRSMEERGLDAAVVSGPVTGNPSMFYMANGAALSKGMLVKKRGEPPVLCCWPMERDEAAASGLTVVNLGQYDLTGLVKLKGNRLDATVELYRRLFTDLGVQGEVGFYGREEQGSAYALLQALDAALPDVHVRGEFDHDLFTAARSTKEPDEVERIREAGRRTCAVVEDTLAFLRSHAVRDEVLVNADGTPLTLGQVKAHIARSIVGHGLEDPEGVIFSIGADAGVPHSKGKPGDLMRLGQSIVFDIYPREAGGGYFFDLTRTFCLGYAPVEVERAYADVRACVDMLLAAFEVGQPARHYQQMTCQFFEQRGHPTVGTDSKTQVGYVHSVGHGLGLAIHESPTFSDTPDNHARLEPGHVFTVEPGLYYPERGYGVRIEDVVWIDESGAVHNLTRLPKELVVPV